MIKQLGHLHIRQSRTGNRGLARRILLPVLLIFSLLMAAFFIYSYLTNQADNRAREIENSQQAEKFFNSELKRLSDFALGLAIEAANNPDIEAAFAAQDRVKLQDLTLNSYRALDEQFNIPQYQYHLPPATSFLRLHSPDKYGDDLSTFRFTVLQVNATQKPVVGLEVGRGGLGLRGIEPVFFEGRHIGSVEFGLNIDEALVTNLKKEYGNDWRIILTRDAMSLATLEDIAALQEGPAPDLLVLASTIQGVYPDAETYKNVLNGEKLINQVKGSENRTYSVTTMPLRDYSGKTIGAVEIIFDETSAIQAQTRRILYVFLAGLLTLVFGSFSLVTVTNRSLRPLESLTNAAEAIRQGNLNQQVTVTSQDEIGTLATAFNSMTGQLRDLINSLEQRVTDRTKALATSNEVSRRLSTATSPRQLAVEVVEQVQSAFEYYHAHIYFLDEATGDLVMAGGTGEAGAAMLARGHSVPKGRGLVGRAAETNLPVLVPDVSQADGWLANPLLPDTRSEVAVPISSGKQVLGVLDVQQNVVNGLSELDVELLQSLAGQVAISLQNTRSFEESRTKAELESLANTIGQKIQKTSSVEETLQTAIREIGLALGAARVSANIAARSDGSFNGSRN